MFFKKLFLLLFVSLSVHSILNSVGILCTKKIISAVVRW
jgi:hypothetical protein